MAAKPYVPHIGKVPARSEQWIGDPPADGKIHYIVQMRLPPLRGRSYTYIALSDYTLDLRTAQSWLSDIQTKVGEFLREWARTRTFP